MRRLLRQSAWFTLEQGSEIVVQLLLTAWLIRSFDVDGFGTWAMLFALMNLCSVVSLGIGPALLRHLSVEGELTARAAWLRAGLLLFLAGGAAMLLLSALVLALMTRIDAVAPVADELLALLRWSFPALPMAVLLRELDTLLVAALRAEQRHVALLRVEVGWQALWLLGLGLAGAVYREPGPVIALVPLLLLPRVGAHLALLRTSPRQLLHAGSVDATRLRALLRFARWQWLRAIGATLFSSVDRLLVGSVLGTPALAVYTVCLQLASLVNRGVGMLLQPLFRWSSAQPDLAAALRPHRRRFLWLQLGVLALGVGFAPLAVMLLPLWLGTDGEAHATTMVWAVAAATLLALHVAPNQLQLAGRDNRLAALAGLAGGAASLAALYLLLPLGLDAAMAARCIYGACFFATWPALFRLLRSA